MRKRIFDATVLYGLQIFHSGGDRREWFEHVGGRVASMCSASLLGGGVFEDPRELLSQSRIQEPVVGQKQRRMPHVLRPCAWPA